MQLFSRVCLKCRKVVNFHFLQDLRCLSDCATEITQENMEVLMKLGYSKKDADTLLTISSVRNKKLKKTVDVLQRLGYTREDIYKTPKIFDIPSAVIDHRFKALEEGGFIVEKISLHLLTKRPGAFNKTIHLLKRRGFIESNTEVVTNILSYSDMPSELYTVEETDHLPFSLAQILAKKSYLAWKFNISEVEIVKKLKLYQPVRYKSIRILKQNYDFLTNVLQLPNEKIIQNFFLMQGHFEDYIEVMECIPTVTEFPAHTVAMINPRILLQRPESLLKIMSILKEYKVFTQRQSTLIPLFSLAPNTVQERIEKLWSDPAFRPYFHNPRILKMIVYYHKVTKRYKFLDDSNWRHKSLHLLSSDGVSFNCKYKFGDDKNKGADVVYMIRRELGMKPAVIRDLFSNHPLWACIPIDIVADTLEYLQGEGFQQSHIASALPIVLFPRSEVMKCLEELDSQPEVDCCRDASGQLRQELVLQLALYYLERPYHFSGKSIWKSFKNNSVTGCVSIQETCP